MSKRVFSAFMMVVWAAVALWTPSVYAKAAVGSIVDDPDGGDELTMTVKNDPDGGDEVAKAAVSGDVKTDPDSGDEVSMKVAGSVKDDPDGGDEVTTDPDGGDEAAKPRMSSNEASASGALKTIAS